MAELPGDAAEDAEAVAAEPALAEEEEEEQAEETSWEQIKSKLRLEGAGASAPLFLELFERRYEIDSVSAAFSKIKAFLGDYMVQEFDYKDFCERLGTVSARTIDDEEAWSAHVAKNLAGDIGGAAALMLRIATAVARAFSLQMSDWRDINEACSSALRLLPACYQLQRELPGPLNDARALKHLPVPATEAGRDVNPWRSEEGQELFEKAHKTKWSTMETVCGDDGKPSACFAGACTVVEATPMEDVAFVKMEVARVSAEDPGGFPSLDLKVGDKVVWEVDAMLGKQLLPGVTIEGDWYALESEICFMSSLATVAPVWA